eukprot:COSAG02_NODE_67032_length_254_cov_0.606452_1_plen_42_part_10
MRASQEGSGAVYEYRAGVTSELVEVGLTPSARICVRAAAPPD